MKRRSFIQSAAALWGCEPLAWAQTAGQTPLVEDHFPSRLYQFVWRNWELANLDRMAKVVGAASEQLDQIGRSMGLPPKRRLSDDQLRRIYVTAIRQNWHLLPEPQIVELLGWDEARFRFTLKEDDFLDVKLVVPQPKCEPVHYRAPSAEEKKRAAEIKALVGKWFGARLSEPGENLFAFVNELSTRPSGSLRNPARRAAPGEIDLAQGWSIADGAPETAPAREHLRQFLTERMGVRLGGPHRVELTVMPQSGRATWTVDASSDRIALSGSGSRALLKAVYELETDMERREGPFVEPGRRTKREIWSPRYLYSYFALYGDPLMEGDAAGLPDAYLERAAMAGVDGVWIQGVLNTLAPSRTFPEFGEGWQTRLRNLRELIERASKFGVAIYLYMNEPRAMPDAFFASRPEMRGTRHQDLYAMCTSAEPVRDWLRQSVSHVFREAPGLGGLFSITMSENHTNCYSHGGAWGDKYPQIKDCPRCSRRKPEDVIAEMIACLRDGVREHSQTAAVISYDWGWGTPLADALIPKLPRDSAVLSISEWSQPVSRGGVTTAVGEYSMSVAGPGPRARRNWKLARQHGLATVAKTQFNNTWEISAVPWIPVLPLVVEHCAALAAEGVDGTMPSWTCGGYPSSNLRAAAAYATEPRPQALEVLRSEAERLYGSAGAPAALAAWQAFSDAFRAFPYGVAIYIIPTQHGPANLLRLSSTGLKPGMILFPHDAYKGWSGAYPPAAVQSQFRKLAAKWSAGLADLERAVAAAPGSKKKLARRELAIARTCHHHFESTANQVEFYILRDSLPAANAAESKRARTRMLALTRDEMELSRKQYFVARNESLIGYEASNHYYYTPLDLVEKILNCDSIVRRLGRGLA